MRSMNFAVGSAMHSGNDDVRERLLQNLPGCTKPNLLFDGAGSCSD